MKYLHILLLFLIIGCHNSKGDIRNTNSDAAKKVNDLTNAKDTLYLNLDIDLDSFLNKFISHQICFKYFSPKIETEDSGGDIQYTINSTNNIKFNNTKDNRRIVYLDNRPLKSEYIKFQNDVDFSFDVNIYYKDSEFYKSYDSKFILIISNPGNFTGLMTNFSFFQLIDIEKRRLFEFFNFGGSPSIIVNLQNDINILKIYGEYIPEREDWILTIMNKSLLNLNKSANIPIVKSLGNIDSVKCLVLK